MVGREAGQGRRRRCLSPRCPTARPVFPRGSQLARERPLQLRLVHPRASANAAPLGRAIELRAGLAVALPCRSAAAPRCCRALASRRCSAACGSMPAFLLLLCGLPAPLLRLRARSLPPILRRRLPIGGSCLTERDRHGLASALNPPATAAFKFAMLPFMHDSPDGSLLSAALSRHHCISQCSDLCGRSQKCDRPPEVYRMPMRVTPPGASPPD